MAELSGCREVRGDVELAGAYVWTTSGLFDLERIDGDLRIHDTNIEVLDGLERLAHVAGVIDIHNNTSLETLASFDDLEGAGGLYIESNHRLTRIPGFPTLTNLGGLVIRDNLELHHVGGFDALESMAGPLHIELHGHIDGFSQLLFIDGDLTLRTRGDPGLAGEEEASNQPTTISGFDSFWGAASPGFALAWDTDVLTGFDWLGPDLSADLIVHASAVTGLTRVSTVEGSVTIDASPGEGSTVAGDGDAFGWTTNLRAVTGALVVDGPIPGDAFARLVVVGDLSLGTNTPVRTAGRWPSLTTAGSIDIVLQDNAADLSGFSQLSTAHALTIRTSSTSPQAGPARLLGFDALTSLERGLTVVGLHRLTELGAFGALTTVGAGGGTFSPHAEGASVVLRDLPLLSALDGLRQLTSVPHALRLDHVGLASFPPWSDLTVTHTIEIAGVAATALPTLPRTTSLRELVIRENPALTELGLTHVDSVPGRIEIWANPALPCATAASYVDRLLTPPAFLILEDNLNPCPWPR